MVGPAGTFILGWVVGWGWARKKDAGRIATLEMQNQFYLERNESLTQQVSALASPDMSDDDFDRLLEKLGRA